MIRMNEVNIFDLNMILSSEKLLNTLNMLDCY